MTLGVVSQADAKGLFGGEYNCADGNVPLVLVMVEDITGDGIPEYVNIYEAIQKGWITGEMARYLQGRSNILLNQVLRMYIENFNLKTTGFFDSRASVDDIRPNELMAEFYLYANGMGGFTFDMDSLRMYDCINWPGGWDVTYYTPVYQTYNPYLDGGWYVNYGAPTVAIDLNGDYYPDVYV